MSSFSCFIENKGVTWLVYLIKEIYYEDYGMCFDERSTH